MMDLITIRLWDIRYGVRAKDMQMDKGQLILRPEIPARDKLILTGLYLSKYDSVGLKELGFRTFQEAFNIIGFALGSQPASIKNYRDEFDPLFPNKRKGWHKRGTRDYCLSIFELYKDVDFALFTELIKSFFTHNDIAQTGTELTIEDQDAQDSSFAQRLITGLAAENYFESKWTEIEAFRGYGIENTTRLGCGYDFRLTSQSNRNDFLAVEVKGLRDLSGNLSMTPKEYKVASKLKERFYLFAVCNFKEVPTHKIFRSPLESCSPFSRIERIVVQISWLTKI